MNRKGPAFLVPAEHSVLYNVAGFGGYGDPAKRGVAKLRDDIINGYVSEEKAVKQYGMEKTSDLRCPHCVEMHRKK